MCLTRALHLLTEMVGFACVCAGSFFFRARFRVFCATSPLRVDRGSSLHFHDVHAFAFLRCMRYLSSVILLHFLYVFTISIALSLRICSLFFTCISLALLGVFKSQQSAHACTWNLIHYSAAAACAVRGLCIVSTCAIRLRHRFTAACFILRHTKIFLPCWAQHFKHTRRQHVGQTGGRQQTLDLTGGQVSTRNVGRVLHSLSNLGQTKVFQAGYLLDLLGS